jgi:hypothetical protein
MSKTHKNHPISLAAAASLAASVELLKSSEREHLGMTSHDGASGSEAGAALEASGITVGVPVRLESLLKSGPQPDPLTSASQTPHQHLPTLGDS